MGWGNGTYIKPLGGIPRKLASDTHIRTKTIACRYDVARTPVKLCSIPIALHELAHGAPGAAASGLRAPRTTSRHAHTDAHTSWETRHTHIDGISYALRPPLTLSRPSLHTQGSHKSMPSNIYSRAPHHERMPARIISSVRLPFGRPHLHHVPRFPSPHPCFFYLSAQQPLLSTFAVLRPSAMARNSNVVDELAPHGI